MLLSIFLPTKLYTKFLLVVFHSFNSYKQRANGQRTSVKSEKGKLACTPEIGGAVRVRNVLASAGSPGLPASHIVLV